MIVNPILSFIHLSTFEILSSMKLTSLQTEGASVGILIGIQPRFIKNTGFGSIPNDKMHAWTEGAARAFFRCVRTPDVLAILQYSLIRVFQIVLFIGRTL